MTSLLPVTPDLLVELELIKRCKYAYLRLVDQHRFDELVDVLTEDCTASYSDGKYAFDDRAGIIAFLHESMGSVEFLSSHACHQPEIDVFDDGTATGTWKLEDQVIVGDFSVNLRGAAFYEDRYVKTEAGWRISHTGYSRTFEEMYPQAGVAGLELHANGFTGLRK
jgi:hypothetical protein